MKNKILVKQNASTTKEQIKIHSFNDVFGRDFKSDKFKKTYTKELVRLRLARQIREMRTAKKLTQKDVAQKAEMPQSVIARIESGKHSASLDTLERIAHVFNKEVQFA